MDGRRQGILASFCWVSWMAAIVVLPPEPAGAESRPSTSCRSEPGGTGKVRAITDGRSFTLDDGREIRLAGIEAPLLPGPGEAGTRAKPGLWGEPYYVIVSAESGAELVAESGHFILAEGKVWSVRESGGTIYVNFGRQWSQALTVTILKRNERMFAAAGIEPKRLENRNVRVRGWVEERNGPRIEVTRPEQIEIAGRN